MAASTGVHLGYLYRRYRSSSRAARKWPCLRMAGARAVCARRALPTHRRYSDPSRWFGAAGACPDSLQHDRAIADWIAQQVRAKCIPADQTSTIGGLRLRFRDLKHLHADIIRQCKLAGLSAAGYPFTTQRKGSGPFPNSHARSACAALHAAHGWPGPAAYIGPPFRCVLFLHGRSAFCSCTSLRSL
jgi:hypothetical protein